MLGLYRNQFYIAIKSKSTWIMQLIIIVGTLITTFLGEKNLSIDETILSSLKGMDIFMVSVIFSVIRTSSFFKNSYYKTISQEVRNKINFFWVCISISIEFLALAFILLVITTLSIVAIPNNHVKMSFDFTALKDIAIIFMLQSSILIAVVYVCCILRSLTKSLILVLLYLTVFSALVWNLINMIFIKLSIAFDITSWIPTMIIIKYSTINSNDEIIRILLLVSSFIAGILVLARFTLKKRSWI